MSDDICPVCGLGEMQGNPPVLTVSHRNCVRSMEQKAQRFRDYADSADRQCEREKQRAEQAEAEVARLKMQAQIWAQEAKTQRTTVHEAYQVITGSTGEPGDWHGSEPVRALKAEVERLKWMLSEVGVDYEIPDHDVYMADLACRYKEAHRD